MADINYISQTNLSEYHEKIKETFEDKQTAQQTKSALEASIALKADKTTTYSKEEADAKITEVLAAANKITAQVVDSTDSVNQENVIYLIKKEDAVGDDKYEEYMYLNQQPTKIGETSTDLTNYYQKDTIDSKFTDLSNTYDIKGAADTAKTEAQNYTDIKIQKESVKYATSSQGEKADSAVQPTDLKEATSEFIQGLFSPAPVI